MVHAAQSHGSDGTVTASELVRHFGHWQRRAAQSPVYVLNHGRPQLVLASVEFMQAVASARSGMATNDLQNLLDCMQDPTLLVSAEGMILAIGRATGLHFGRTVQVGAHLSDLLPDEAAAFLGTIVARVAETRIGERTELPAAGAVARLEVTLEPAPNGVMIVGRSAILPDARDAALAQAAAMAAAVTALPHAALATIGPRGYLLTGDSSLAELSGFAPHTLATVRIVTLFSVASRVSVADTVEFVFAHGIPSTVTADLLTAGGPSLTVSVGLSPVRQGLATTALLAVLVAQGPPISNRA